eukprot:CAMPEP_0175967330 /NCGR_PEP_ID=MMETSP0108-20121206/39230_1 /TAXON_ID=195067 ORGANISM="Goniomonas pacifica, Strain CCMP1869" /NCGR_SAMPLE_ID=MMETSP0108 /ASSEMBLY_ACC=CAM_ASM_000204 /LENGTH=87 /DNA_ID=CAMNT_0017295757 /DNA_START=202 /DNA_END=466 /DNA_ORIENTATION=-
MSDGGGWVELWERQARRFWRNLAWMLAVERGHWAATLASAVERRANGVACHPQSLSTRRLDRSDQRTRNSIEGTLPLSRVRQDAAMT